MRTTQVLRLLLCVVLVSAMSVACLAMVDQWEESVTIEIRDMDIREALAELFKGRGLSFSIAPDVTGKIPVLKFVDVPFRVVLDNFAKAADLVYRIIENDIVVFSRPPGYDPFAKQVNVEFKDTPLADAIETLMKDAGINYTVDPNVNYMRVTAVLKFVSLQKALSEITKAAGAEFQIKDGVVNISGPQGYGARSGYPVPRGGAARPGPAPGENLVTEIIPLNYADPGDIAPFLVQEGIHSVSAVSGRRLVIRGTEDGIEQAKKMIRALDVEQVLPRPIRIRLAASVTLGNGQAQSADLSTESIGPEGHPIPLNISSGSALRHIGPYLGPSRDTTAPNWWIKRPPSLSATLTPTVGEDGRIVLAGNGRIECNVEGAEPMSGWQISKSFEVAVSAAQGKPVTIAAGEASVGTDRAEFVITATATVEPGRVQIPPPMSPGYGGYGGYGGGYPGGGYGGGYGGYPIGVSPAARPPGFTPVGPPAPNPEEHVPVPPPGPSGPPEPAPPPK